MQLLSRLIGSTVKLFCRGKQSGKTFNREGSLYLACNENNAFFYYLTT